MKKLRIICFAWFLLQLFLLPKITNSTLSANHADKLVALPFSRYFAIGTNTSFSDCLSCAGNTIEYVKMVKMVKIYLIQYKITQSIFYCKNYAT